MSVLRSHTPFPNGYTVSRWGPLLSILRGFYNAVSLPGDCHVASLLAMTEYFVRNVTRVCLPESNSKIYVRSLCFSVQRTLCHCETPLSGVVAISRKGHRIIKPTQDTFVLAWRKKGANKHKSEHYRER